MCSLALTFTRTLFIVGSLGIVLSVGGTSLHANGTSSKVPETSHSSSLVPAADSSNISVFSVPADRCHPSSCKLPDCRCVGTDIPGQFRPREIPQMVLLTLDDEVTVYSYRYYQGLFLTGDAVIRNPNGCSATATFFVSGPHSNMTIVKALVERGHEVGSHSLSHDLSPSHPWTPQAWDTQMHGMRRLLAHGTGLNTTQIRGMRAPNLQLGGDAQFSMLKDRGFLYDSSMYGGTLTEDGGDPLWPFTLDFPPYLPTPNAVCDQADCPTRSYPQLWEVPLVRLYTLSGQPCSMTDSCPLDVNSSKGKIMAFLRHNFNRHYFRNRAPFMIAIHPLWFSKIPASHQALKEFLLEVSHKPDVWQLTLSQMLDWARHPRPLNRLHELHSWQCQNPKKYSMDITVLFITLTALLSSLIIMSIVLELKHAGLVMPSFRRLWGGGYRRLPLQDPDHPMEETSFR